MTMVKTLSRKMTMGGVAFAGFVSAILGPTMTILPAAAGTPVDCVTPLTDDRCERWFHRYTKGSGEAPFGRHQTQMALAGALSRSGNRAFTLGYRVDIPNGRFKYDMQTVAYDVATGAPLWAATEAGPTDEHVVFPRNVVVSPDEKTVYVMGTVFLDPGSSNQKDRDLLVAAYDAATGDRLWKTVYDGPGRAQDDAWAAVVSPDSERLYVAAAATASDLPVKPSSGAVPLARRWEAGGLEVDLDLALLTFDGAAGAVLAEDSYAGAPFAIDGVTHGSWDVATDIFVSGDGGRLVVAGISSGRETYRQNGRPHAFVSLWERRADGEGWATSWLREIPGSPMAAGLVESQETIALAGFSGQGATESNPYSVVGLSLADGSTRWETPIAFGGINGQLEHPRGLVVDEQRGKIYVPGVSRWPTSSTGTASVLTLRTSDGTQVWRKRLRDPRSEATIIFNYDSDDMITGSVDRLTGHLQLAMLREGRLTTMSLDHTNGAQRWIGVFDHPVRTSEPPERAYNWPIRIEAAGGKAVVFGTSYIDFRDSCPGGFLGSSPCSRDDFLTISYDV